MGILFLQTLYFVILAAMVYDMVLSVVYYENGGVDSRFFGKEIDRLYAVKEDKFGGCIWRKTWFSMIVVLGINVLISRYLFSGHETLLILSQSMLGARFVLGTVLILQRPECPSKA